MASVLRTSFFIAGKPKGKGSYRAITSKSTGKAFVKPAKGDAEWQSWARLVAAQKHKGAPIDGPVWIIVEAYFEQPRSHYRTGKYSHLLKESAPRYHTSKPDVDKLARSLLDAMSGVVYGDDRQVVELTIGKYWNHEGREGVDVDVYEESNG